MAGALGVASSPRPTSCVTPGPNGRSVFCARQPRGVLGRDVAQVSASSAVLCVVQSDGTAACLGSNGSGQLARPTTPIDRGSVSASAVPLPIAW